MSSDKFNLIAWVLAGVLLGTIVGVLLIMMFSRRISHIEIVRDASGRIVQIVEIDDIQPVSGRRVMNVETVKEKSSA